MSFILDALKKSETDRQQQGSGEFAGVPTSRDAARVPGWLWALGLLLAVNFAVLLGLLLRPAAVAPVPSSSVSAARLPATELPEPRLEIDVPPAATDDSSSFAAQVAAAKQNAPPPRQRVATVSQEPRTTPDVVPGVVRTPPARTAAALPTLQQVQANGAVDLPELHLDIHVYSDKPDDRFVFINMSKQRENSRLDEGPLVEEITPDGVVLQHQGTTFLLPRE
ncbi:MAG: GspB domain-containing protein [Woeseiaceae bacterium]|nr:GspB domain-containing protein [Woeseiaceae bacterium]